MREPYFKVGEEVILVSRSFPEYDGEYVVRGVIERECGSKKWVGSGQPPKGKHLLYELGLPVLFIESALRKKYPPSSEGFQDMMQKIKDNVLEGVE